MDGTILIYTDLDGTLLDDAYSIEGAEEALAAIRRRGIPLIACSSKTRGEVERLRLRLGLEDPFIVENGAACFLPEGWRGIAADEGSRDGPYRMIRLGADYERIRRFLAERGRDFGVRGFGDATASEIARRAGLSLEDARLARRREFSEPFWFEGEQRPAELAAAAAREGLEITRGGRFHHLVGRGADKGAAVRRLTALLGRHLPGPLLTVGLGDGMNDLPLLAAVDRAVLFPRADGSFEPCTVPGVLHARGRGGRAWNEAVMTLLEELEPRRGSSP